MCPVQAAKQEESGSTTGQVLPTHGLADSLILLAARIEAQTEAINNLAESNFALVQAMSESHVDDDAPPTNYLSGKPVR